MKLADIKVAIGGDISTSNSKMPGASFGHSTDGCKVGAALRHVEGSTCHKCYAKRLENMRPSVKQGWANRTAAIREAMGDCMKAGKWIDAMIQRIETKCAKTGPFFRWHDSGDLLGLEHLRMIVEVAYALPNVRFWLPTREKAIVREWLRQGYSLPVNLTVRLSAAMVDGKPINAGEGVNTSTVHKHGKAHGHSCPASTQGNACGECRACWDKTVSNVSYPLH